MEEYDKAIAETEKLFSKQQAPIESLSLEDLESMEGIEKFDFDLAKMKSGVDVVTFLAETGIFPSKGEARKMVQGGGVSINRNKISDISMQVTETLLLHRKYLLVQKGRKNNYLVQAV
jgi:tyrosyl-tRNA synthetase